METAIRRMILLVLGHGVRELCSGVFDAPEPTSSPTLDLFSIKKKRKLFLVRLFKLPSFAYYVAVSMNPLVPLVKEF